MGISCSQCIEYEEIPYEKLKDFAENGDPILFVGSGLFSWEVQIATCSLQSHIALIVKLPNDFEDDLFEGKRSQDGLYMLQSLNGIIKGIPDVLTGKEKGGLQLNSLKACMSCCIADVTIRRLIIEKKYKKELDPTNKNSALYKYMKKYKGAPYEQHFSELCLSIMPFCHPSDNKDSLFCSELVAEVYRDIGILPKEINSSEYIPKSFSDMETDGFYEFWHSKHSNQSTLVDNKTHLSLPYRILKPIKEKKKNHHSTEMKK